MLSYIKTLYFQAASEHMICALVLREMQIAATLRVAKVKNLPSVGEDVLVALEINTGTTVEVHLVLLNMRVWPNNSALGLLVKNGQGGRAKDAFQNVHSQLFRTAKTPQ